MQRFIAQIKRLPVQTVVTGNQALDLDSFCSSLLTAYFETLNGRQCTPLIPIDREDLRLRKDVELILTRLDINMDSLLFLDEFSTNTETPLFLVDHNLQFMQGKVTGIIDHHAPESDKTMDDNINPMVLSRCSSAMSLVLKYYNEKLDLKKLFASDPMLAPLAFAPIAIDTSNFFNMKPEDITAYQFLANFINQIPDTITFQTVRDARKDITGLSYSDLLRKDFKQWEEIGISTLPKRFHKLDLEELSCAMIDYKNKLGLEVLAAMACGKKGRDFAYLGPKEFDVVTACSDMELILQKEVNGVQFFSQMQTTYSRKMVAPILRQAYAKFKQQ